MKKNLYDSFNQIYFISTHSRTDEENFEDYGVGESDSSDANHS